MLLLAARRQTQLQQHDHMDITLTGRYLVKPARSRWEDGVLALEGGGYLVANASRGDQLTCRLWNRRAIQPN